MPSPPISLLEKQGISLYVQLAGILRAQFTSGNYKPGDSLPTEEQVAKDFEVSLVTVREARRLLAEEGLISRYAGRGTFAKFNAGFAIFRVGDLDEDGVLFDFNKGEVEARKAMVDSCRSTILVADASKFGRSATVRGGHVRDLDHLFTDQAIPVALAAIVAESGICLRAPSASMVRAA